MKFYRMESRERDRPEDAFSGLGGIYASGRWNTMGIPVVYAADTPALAYLEVLAHRADRATVDSYVLYEIEVPEAKVQEKLAADLPDGWNLRPPVAASRLVGDKWLKERQSVVLSLPSVIVPMQRIALINPKHPELQLSSVRKAVTFPHDSRIRK